MNYYFKLGQKVSSTNVYFKMGDRVVNISNIYIYIYIYIYWEYLKSLAQKIIHEDLI